MGIDLVEGIRAERQICLVLQTLVECGSGDSFFFSSNKDEITARNILSNTKQEIQ